jgi:opacity protein-like surface antigen
MVFGHLAVERMFIVFGQRGFALVVVALCLGGPTAYAQTAPLTYWTPCWPLGFGDNSTSSQSANTYGNFPSFDGSDARGGGFSSTRYHFGNGWFVGSERGGMGLSGIRQDAAFGNFGALYSEGVQFGYSFKNSGLPLTVYGGFDSLKYKPGIGGAFAPLDSMSGTLPGYSAHAGVEFQPAPNVSLSLGVGYTQQSQRIDSDINSPLLPGAAPFALGGRR